MISFNERLNINYIQLILLTRDLRVLIAGNEHILFSMQLIKIFRRINIYSGNVQRFYESFFFSGTTEMVELIGSINP